MRHPRTSPLLTLLLSLLLAPPAAAGEPQTLLLVDDHHVLYRAGTERVLTPLTRHPANPLIKPEHPWEVLLAYCTVHHDPATGKYQLWYQSWSGNRARERSHNCVVAYAESDDGVRFAKPALDLFPFDDARRTNIVLVGNGGHSFRYANSVLVDPRDPDPRRRYKMGYFDWGKDGGREYPGLHVAFSPDGVRWTRHPEGLLSRVAYGDFETPVPLATEADAKPWLLPLSMSDAVDICYDPARDVFAWYGKMWLNGPAGGLAWKHAMGRSESRDFVRWSKPELVCAPDDHDGPSVEFHTSPVFHHAGVYFCLNQILDRATRGGAIEVELMVSRDGIRWDRPFRGQRLLPRRPDAGFDSGSVFTNATPVVLDDEVRFYYGGYSMGATDDANDYAMSSGIGLATLPRDRFAGIRPVARSDQPTLRHPLEHVGQVTLRPLDLSAARTLTVNADAGTAGSVRVEVLTEDGYRLPHFTADDATPVTGDSLRHPVAWKTRTPADLPPGRYMLRLHLRNATVYAVTLSP